MEGVIRLLDDRKGKYLVILVWVVTVALAAVFGAFKFAEYTFDNFVPSKELQSYPAFQQFLLHADVFLNADAEVVYITTKDGSHIVNNATRSLCSELDSMFTTLPDETKKALMRVDSYFHYENTPLQPQLNTSFLNQNDSGMIYLVVVNSAKKSAYTPVIKAGRDAIPGLQARYPTLDVVQTGRLTLAQIADDATGLGFALGDGIGLPFIVIVFWFNVGAFRLLIIPGLALGCSLVLSYGTGVLLTKVIEIPSYEPNIVLFLCLALSIDYSFFLLTRFQEELQQQQTVRESVSRSLRYSGGTVLVSGLILVVTWVANLFFPVFGLDSVGICSACTVLICMVVNLTLCPSLLLAFPIFFSNGGFAMGDKCGCRKMQRSGSVYLLQSPGEQQRRKAAPKVGCYRWLAERSTKWPGSVVMPLLCYAGFVVGCLQLLDLKLILAANVSFGSDSVESRAFADVSRNIFNDDVQSSFAIISTVPSSNPNLFYQQYFDATCELATAVSGVARVSPALKSIATAPFTPGKPLTCLSLDQVEETLQDSNELYTHNFPKIALQGNTSSLLLFFAEFNPFSTEVKGFINDIRAQLQPINDKYSAAGINFQLYHPMCAEADGSQFVAKRFAWVCGLILILVFLVIAIRFKAAFVPFKLFLTVVVPIMFVYGIAVLVYQKGSFHTRPINNTGGISWLTPTANVFLLLGLALDYDIFLFSRIYELRKTGDYTTRESIIEAVTITGPVISGAGIIMALAFTGMLVSSISFLNQFGFTMILGVLLDTFVVRIVLVPAFLSLGECLNWWPGKMPMVFRPIDSDS